MNIKNQSNTRGMQISEIVNQVQIEGKIWAISESPKNSSRSLLEIKDNRFLLNELATQIHLPPKEFLCLTTSSFIFYFLFYILFYYFIIFYFFIFYFFIFIFFIFIFLFFYFYFFIFYFLFYYLYIFN